MKIFRGIRRLLALVAGALLAIVFIPKNVASKIRNKTKSTFQDLVNRFK